MFYELFPTVFTILNMFKKYSYQLPWYRKDKPHAALAVLLQFVESFLIIDVICKRISEEHPQVPLFTIHDNILTTKGNEGIVKKVMKEVTFGFLGKTATIRIEDYSK